LKKFNEISNEWLLSKKGYLKQSSYSNYYRLVNLYNSQLMSIDEINNHYIQALINKEVKEKKKVKTIKDKISVLKMILKYSWKRGYSSKFEFDLHYPKVYKLKYLNVIPNYECSKLRIYLENNINYKNFGILLCMCTGIRIGEICALQLKDFDLEHQVINIVKTLTRTNNDEQSKTEIIITKPKTQSSYRQVPLANSSKKLVKTLYKDIDESNFILSGTNKAIEPRNMRRYFDCLIRKLGIQKVSFHGLRHTFASNMIAAGVDPKTLSVILGHSNVNTTLNLYVHPSEKLKKSCIERMWKKI